MAVAREANEGFVHPVVVIRNGGDAVGSAEVYMNRLKGVMKVVLSSSIAGVGGTL